ncbi:MAG: Rid family detoxifying hydrolase [Zoogloeaceae bacterium]|jgi:reactive intermediate/imine deaminase|nr:Rid family detoxifying hydrolase [Zoogloeaceae bacterium]
MQKTIIATDKAPAAIGTYSQAVKVIDAAATLYVSGQIGLNPANQTLVDGIDAQVAQVFENLKAVVGAAGGSLSNVVRLNVYLADMTHFAKINEAMTRYFSAPYPARAAVGVRELPKGALVEVDAIACLNV